MSRTINALERHMTWPVRHELQSPGSKLVAEWQQRGPETLSGHALRKLRLVLLPTRPLTTASVAN